MTHSAHPLDHRTIDERVDFFLLFAQRVMDVPPGWQWRTIDKVGSVRNGDGVLVIRGGIPSFFKSGKRVGQPDWSKVQRPSDFAVSCAELDAFIERWEIETGRCSKCQGSGEEISGWSREAGTLYRGCSKCGGSGRPNLDEHTEPSP